MNQGLRTHLLMFCLTAIALLVAACGKKEEPPSPPVAKPSHTTVEEQREQGRQNAAVNAVEYQRQNPRVQGWDVIIKADSFHTADCPQGDGWAEVVFMYAEREEGKLKNVKVEKATVMCSTVSFNEGCVMVSPVNNWDKHPKKTMDGRCGDLNEVPFPLPKVVARKL